MALLPADAPSLYMSLSAKAIPWTTFLKDHVKRQRTKFFSTWRHDSPHASNEESLSVVCLSICLLPVRGLPAEPDKAHGRGPDPLEKDGQS